jgi:hypothetical protein
MMWIIDNAGEVPVKQSWTQMQKEKVFLLSFSQLILSSWHNLIESLSANG